MSLSVDALRLIEVILAGYIPELQITRLNTGPMSCRCPSEACFLDLECLSHWYTLAFCRIE